MGGPFQYHVALEETSIAEVFWTIYRHKVPGLIEISREGIEKRIYINDGNVIHASSTDRTDRLGAFLYRLGKLTRNDLVDTMRERELTGKRHGQLLIEKGMLPPAELYDAIKMQMETIVWSVFSWQSGDLTFKIGEFNDPMMVKILLPMRQMIIRGIKKVQDTKGLVDPPGQEDLDLPADLFDRGPDRDRPRQGRIRAALPGGRPAVALRHVHGGAVRRFGECPHALRLPGAAADRQDRAKKVTTVIRIQRSSRSSRAARPGLETSSRSSI